MNMKSIKKSRNMRGVLGMENIPKIVISLGIAVFALALVVLFLAKFDSATDDANASQSIQEGIAGLREFDNWWSLLVISGVFLILFAVMFVIARQAKGGGF